jgi:Tol biopolymer transport system component
MDITGDNRRPLVIGGAPHWSPDGGRVVYHYRRREGGFHIGLFDIDTGVETALDGPGVQMRDPLFSPDGRFLILSAQLAFSVAALGESESGAPEVTNVVSFNHLKGIDAHVSPDGSQLVWVENTHKSAGSWLFHASFGPDGTIGKKAALPLGWEKGPSANYHPHFSPCGRYLVYAHAKSLPDVKSWQHTSKHELYVTRFPSCDATVRITWNNAGNKHPHWWKKDAPRLATEMEGE